MGVGGVGGGLRTGTGEMASEVGFGENRSGSRAHSEMVLD